MKTTGLCSLIMALMVTSCSVQIQRGRHEYSMNYDIPANSTLSVGNKSADLYRVLLKNVSEVEIGYSFNGGDQSALLQPGDSTFINARLKEKIRLSNATGTASKVKVVVSDNKYKLKTAIRNN